MNNPQPPVSSGELRKVLTNRMSLLQHEDHHLDGISQADEAQVEYYVDEIMQLIEDNRAKLIQRIVSELPKDYLECEKYPGITTKCNSCYHCKKMHNLDFNDGYEYGLIESKAAIERIAMEVV